MHSDAEVRACLARVGLDALTDRVLADTRPEIRITATLSESPELGRSRIGGAPDLPRGTVWPRQRWPRSEVLTWPDYAQAEVEVAIANGQVIIEGDQIAFALPFVAQLDLAELAPLQAVFPRRGHLWLFAEQCTTLGEIAGYFYCASACIYSPPGSVDDVLVRVKPPPVSEDYAAGILTFALDRSFPNANDLGLAGDDWYRYTAAIKDVEQPAPRHVSLARPEYGSIAPVPPDDWTAVLVVDTDYALGTHWGDAAWITFAIPDAALAAGRFDEVRAFRWYG